MDQRLLALGSRLRELRKDKNLSIRALAGFANIDKNQLLNIEHGKVNLRYLTLCDLAEALSVTVGDLTDTGY